MIDLSGTAAGLGIEAADPTYFEAPNGDVYKASTPGEENVFRALGYEKMGGPPEDQSRVKEGVSPPFGSGPLPGPDPGVPSTQVVTYWENPQTGEVVQARNGAEAARLEAQGYVRASEIPPDNLVPLPGPRPPVADPDPVEPDPVEPDPVEPDPADPPAGPEGGSETSEAGLLSASGLQTILLAGLGGFALRQIISDAQSSSSDAQS
jgi:hypothetical protein